MQRRVRWSEIPQYGSAPSPCPYLPARQESKLLIPLGQAEAQDRYDTLIRHGFRRAGRWAYRPSCEGCDACVAVRVAVAAFQASRGQRRAARWLGGLARTAAPTHQAALRGARATTAEDYDLLQRYLQARHGDGEMVEMSAEAFEAMACGLGVRSALLRWRDPGGALAAAMLIDEVADGLSLVYSMFDPALSRHSPGTAMVVDAVGLARQRRLPYAYLGFLVEGCRKMDYKAGFVGLERLGAAGWARVDDGQRAERLRQRLGPAAGGEA
jgi:arginine-tRNA-protein transferase